GFHLVSFHQLVRRQPGWDSRARTPTAAARYGHVTEARHGPYNVIRSGQETVNEVEPLFVCHGLPHSLGLRIEDTHGRSAHDGARGIVSHAADSAPIRLCLEKTGRLEKTCQDKQSRENLFD